MQFEQRMRQCGRFDLGKSREIRMTGSALLLSRCSSTRQKRCLLLEKCPTQRDTCNEKQSRGGDPIEITRENQAFLQPDRPATVPARWICGGQAPHFARI